jgi:uncharacterized protein YndB with AHSA1/START domain
MKKCLKGRMTMAKVSPKVRIRTPRADVFNALSTVEGLTGWYTPHLDANAAKGNEVTFRFTGREPFAGNYGAFTEVGSALGLY